MTTCGDVMTRNPMCCVMSDTADRAAEMMKNEDVGSIPVVESRDSKKLVGIVTDRDLALKVVAEGRNGRDVKLDSVMSRNPVTCGERDNLDNALKAMSDHQIRRIPIVNDRREIVGIISQADVATRAAEPQKTAEVVQDISQPNGNR
jgi:CBS domain-containing protein